MSTKSFYIAVFFILAAVRLIVVPMQVGDLAVWIADGLKAIELNQYLTVDVFSIHKNLLFNYPSRISNTIFGYLYKYFGYLSVVIFLRLSIMITFSYIFLKYVRGKVIFNPINLMLLSVATLGMTFPMDRPQILIAIFAIITLEHIYQKNLILRDYYHYFFVCLLWINFHPSLFILFPVLGWSLIISLIKKENNRLQNLYLIVLTLGATALTHTGLNIYEYVYKTIYYSKVRNISEWQSIISFDYPYFSQLYFAGVIFLLITVYKKQKMKELIYHPYFPLVLLGMTSIRNIFWFFLILIPLFDHLSLFSLRENKSFLSTKKNAFAMGVIILFVMGLFSYTHFKSKNMGYSIDAPVMATKKLSNIKRPLKIFNQWEFGSYLILKQQHKIFIDTRNIIYSDKIFNDYKSILNRINSTELLSKYNINAVILRNKNFPLVTHLKKLKNWDLVFSSSHSLLFIKK